MERFPPWNRVRMTRGLFVFRRDLRLEDNLGLIALLEACDEVACMFVGTPEQLQKNKLRNPRATAFLTECLTDLAEDLKKRGASLYIAYGDPVDEVIRVAKSIDATHLAYNIDYTPYARNRDASLTSAAEKERITVIATQDYALSDVIGLRTAGGQGNPYTVFTPFWRAVEANTIPHPISNRTRTK
jgi:deoxyribodipyrimidine photo-lyase